MGRRGRRSRQLLDNIKETRGYRELKEDDYSLRRTRFGRSCGCVGRQKGLWICGETEGAVDLWGDRRGCGSVGREKGLWICGETEGAVDLWGDRRGCGSVGRQKGLWICRETEGAVDLRGDIPYIFSQSP
jgi:hypothetical protein